MDIRAKAICQLSDIMQARIRHALILALSDIEMENEEREEAIENGMNGKVSDLSDTIDIDALCDDSQEYDAYQDAYLSELEKLDMDLVCKLANLSDLAYFVDLHYAKDANPKKDVLADYPSLLTLVRSELICRTCDSNLGFFEFGMMGTTTDETNRIICMYCDFAKGYDFEGNTYDNAQELVSALETKQGYDSIVAVLKYAMSEKQA